MGVGRFLKEQNPDIQVWAIEPPAGEMVDGLKNIDEGFIPPVYEDNNGNELLNRRLIVRPRESIEWTRRLTEVGIFAGISSGAILAGAVKAAGLHPEDEEATIVMIVCDGGWKYLSRRRVDRRHRRRRSPRQGHDLLLERSLQELLDVLGGAAEAGLAVGAYQDRALDEDGVGHHHVDPGGPVLGPWP